MQTKILIQTQLSNYDSTGTWILECDSGWQMMIGRLRELLKLRQNISVFITGPQRNTLKTQPEVVSHDVMCDSRVHYIPITLIPNALATRFDFNVLEIATALKLREQKAKIEKPFDIVYINDPMHLRNFAAMFFLYGAKRPRFVVHSHFIDNPECPKFPTDVSLWLGQLEAAQKADWNFWQCASAYNVFLQSARQFLTAKQISVISKKSTPWDDGYSASEMQTEPDLRNVRFDVNALKSLRENELILFVPNRVGGRGRSSDYTNCGKFLFDILPQIKAASHLKFSVIAGNPSQKFSNKELQDECGVLPLVADSFNRDELKVVMQHSHIIVGLYDQDTYGGTASREGIELGCAPLWNRNFEYFRLALASGYLNYLCKADFSDIVNSTIKLMHNIKHKDQTFLGAQKQLQEIVREQCSFERTTQYCIQHLFGE